MRKIRFRAWAHASNIMFYPCMREGWELKDGYINPTPNTTLMQFTGLTDKNGKDIFEGDIVKWYGYEVRDCNQIRPSREFLIEWKYSILHKLENIISHGDKDIEVIGNIHENPNLLEKAL